MQSQRLACGSEMKGLRSAKLTVVDDGLCLWFHRRYSYPGQAISMPGYKTLTEFILGLS